MAYAKGTSEYLLEVLRCGINNLSLGHKPEDIPWEDVFAYSSEHSVSSFAYFVAGREIDPSEKCYSTWRDSYNQHLLQESNQNYELEQLCHLFRQLHIPFAPLKGSCIRELFPIPFLREMCDLDILIPEEYMLTAHEIMLERGYTYEEEHTTSHNREYHKKPYLNVEIHTDVMPKESRLFLYYENIWDRLIPSEDDPMRHSLSWDDFYVYTVAHAYKHYFMLGIGIRSVLDIYVLACKAKDKLNRAYILRELESLGLSMFHDHIEQLAYHWFSSEPSDCSDTVLQFGAEILRCATYGKNYGTTENAIRREVRKGNSLSSAKRRYTRRKIFPGLAFMKSAYPVVNKVPFLFPLFWPVRWISIFFRKPEVIKQHFKDTKSVDLERLKR